MITVEIDKLTHCLVNSETGEEVPTFVKKIKKSSELSNMRKREWYENWKNLFSKYEVYVLLADGDDRIQGAVALENSYESDAVYFAWAVAAPWNNKMFVKQPAYIGVGAHLFAIACNISKKYGHDGVIYGFAANEKLLRHYCDDLGAEPLRILHPYQFILEKKNAKMLMEEYTYDENY